MLGGVLKLLSEGFGLGELLQQSSALHECHEFLELLRQLDHLMEGMWKRSALDLFAQTAVIAIRLDNVLRGLGASCAA